MFSELIFILEDSGKAPIVLPIIWGFITDPIYAPIPNPTTPAIGWSVGSCVNAPMAAPAIIVLSVSLIAIFIQSVYYIHIKVTVTDIW